MASKENHLAQISVVMLTLPNNANAALAQSKQLQSRIFRSIEIHGCSCNHRLVVHRALPLWQHTWFQPHNLHFQMVVHWRRQKEICHLHLAGFLWLVQCQVCAILHADYKCWSVQPLCISHVVSARFQLPSVVNQTLATRMSLHPSSYTFLVTYSILDSIAFFWPQECQQRKISVLNPNIIQKPLQPKLWPLLLLRFQLLLCLQTSQLL